MAITKTSWLDNKEVSDIVLPTSGYDFGRKSTGGLKGSPQNNPFAIGEQRKFGKHVIRAIVQVQQNGWNQGLFT